VCSSRDVVVADVARLGRSTNASLSTVELRHAAGTARVGRVDGYVERSVDEWRVAALSSPCVIVARP